MSDKKRSFFGKQGGSRGESGGDKKRYGESSTQSSQSQQAGRDRGNADETNRGFSITQTFGIPGGLHAQYSAPDDPEDDKRRKTVKKLLQGSSSGIQANTDRSSGICDYHRALDLKSVVKRTPNATQYELGYIDYILSQSSCQLCRFIQCWIHQNRPLFEQDFAPVKCILSSYPSSFSKDNGFFESREADRYAEFRLQASRFGYGFNGLCPTDFQFQTDGRPFLEKADLSLAKDWLKTCCNTHGKICENQRLNASRLFGTIRLLDVMTRRVVTIKTHVDYIALSYVWGPDHLQTVRSTKKNSFDKNGELMDLELRSKLPATIEDAICATKQLGFQYIWIDVVCIVQDDPDHRGSQISRMAQIYSSAVVTIAAAGGDDVGARIPGIQSQSRTPSERVFSVGGLELLHLAPRSNISIRRSTWATRAWTFQERILSKRCLIFTKDQMFFHCPQEVWCENTKADLKFPPPSEIRNVHSRIFEDPKAGAPFFPLFDFLVRSYSQRKLSIAKDVLPAFKGSVFMLEKSYATKFIVGLPQRNFHFALLWQPYEALEVRTKAGSTLKPTLRDYTSIMKDSYLPTWAWAAWVGEVFYPGHELDMSEYRNEVTWQNSHEECSPKPCGLECPGELENNKILKISASYAEFSIKILKESMIDKSNKGTLDFANLRVEPNETGASYANTDLKESSTMKNVLILDGRSNPAGEIILDQAMQFPDNRLYSFISICRCKTIKRNVWRNGWGGDLDLIHKENCLTGQLEQVEWKDADWAYMKVMMIQEDGNFAYRLGVGTIHKGAWDAQKPTSKSLWLV